jgi:hypothetical protein
MLYIVWLKCMFKGTGPIFGATNDLFSRGCLARMWTFFSLQFVLLLVPMPSHKVYYYNVKYEHACCIITPVPFYLTYFLSNVHVSRPDKNTLFWQIYPLPHLYALEYIDVHLLLIKYVVAKLIALHIKVNLVLCCLCIMSINVLCKPCG